MLTGKSFVARKQALQRQQLDFVRCCQHHLQLLQKSFLFFFRERSGSQLREFRMVGFSLMLESGLNPDIFYYFLAVFFARGPVDICCSMGEQAQQTRFSEAAAFTEQEKTLCGSIL